MKQLLILSGKGGTGKTTVAGAFIKLSGVRAYADCDVDAPNLHLIIKPVVEPKKTDYFGLPKAEINTNICTKCDLCRKNCRFDAISLDDIYKINKLACEGCGVCEFLCPTGAITLKPSIAGELRLYFDSGKVFSTAQLKTGSGTSGMLVTKVKKQITTANNAGEIAIIDGSPGIGCPVIASISNVDLILIVTEPSLSGISDMERVIKTAETFQTKVVVCVNKYNVNIEKTEEIEKFCSKREIEFVGKIPFDKDAVKAINAGLTIVDLDCLSGNAVKKIFERVMKIFLEKV